MTDTIEDTKPPSWLNLPTIATPTVPASPTPTVVDDELFGDAFSAPARFDTAPTAVIPDETLASAPADANEMNQIDVENADLGTSDEAEIEPPAFEFETIAEPGEAGPAEVTPADEVTETAPADAEPSPETAASKPETATADELIAAAESYRVSTKIKKFPLIDPDQLWVMWAAIVALGGIVAANLIISFTSVYAMSSTLGLPTAIQWLTVVTLDVAIVGFAWVLMVMKTRGKPIKRTRLYLSIVTSYSVVANFMHTFEHWHGVLTSPPAIYGAVFSASIPLMALAATEELIRLAFIQRQRATKQKDQNS